nr:hypothetical protein [Tanacetum cinerariifolium]
MPKVLLLAWDRVFKIKDAFGNKQYKPEDIQELFRKLFNNVKNIHEELAEYINIPIWNCPGFYKDDDEDYTIAITPDFPITDSLSMGDEHLSTIPETKSDELIMSIVKNLVLNPSESVDLSNIGSECNVPIGDNFTTFSNSLFDADEKCSSSDDKSSSDEDHPKENFKYFSNTLSDEEIISTKIDPHHFNAESDRIEYLLNRDTSIVSSPKFDSLLDEFADELIFLKSIPPGIDEADFDPEEEIHFVERLLYDNSSPRPPKELNSKNSDAIIESFSPSPIPIEDNNSLMEEIDIFLALDDSIPLGIKNDEYYFEGDILFLEEFLRNDSPSLPKHESFPFDVPSSPRPLAKPSDDDGIYFDDEPVTGILTDKVVGYWDKEEKIKKAEEEARLNAISKTEVIKVVHEEAEKIGIYPKEVISSKVGEPFMKAQDAEHEVLKRQHTKKVRKSLELRKHKYDSYMWTVRSRLKPEPITDIKIHPKTKLVVVTVYRGTNERNFDVHKHFLFGAFGISELDELREIIPKKKNTVSDIDKVEMEALVSYLVAASMVKSPKNARFSMKPRKLIAEHPDQEKLKSKKVKLEALGYKMD